MTVHPRLRGELIASYPVVIRYAGSSPLARGTRDDADQDAADIRFIPACAGNSSWGQRFETFMAVHPRLRGELWLKARKTLSSFGSSPLARGTHLKWLQHYTNRLTAKLLKNISKQE